MGLPHHSLSLQRPLSEAELTEWEEAYSAVEAYFQALRLRNRLVVAELVRSVLQRASDRKLREPHHSARELAVEEAMAEISAWTQEILEKPMQSLSMAARSRLALVLADMPTKWQGVLLTPAPWPGEFVAAMRNSYLAAGPRFAQLPMIPKPLELNAIGTGAAQWWETMDRRPTLGKMFGAFLFLLIGTVIWFVFFN